jgi:uncharacterized protein YceH (UPF0502 family)
VDEVRETLDRLQQRGLALRLARGAGQREDRYMHLLCGPVDEASLPAPAPPRRAEAEGTIEARLRELEERVAKLEAALGGTVGQDAD